MAEGQSTKWKAKSWAFAGSLVLAGVGVLANLTTILGYLKVELRQAKSTPVLEAQGSPGSKGNGSAAETAGRLPSTQDDSKGKTVDVPSPNIRPEFGWLAASEKIGLVHPSWGMHFAGFHGKCDTVFHTFTFILDEHMLTDRDPGEAIPEHATFSTGSSEYEFRAEYNYIPEEEDVLGDGSSFAMEAAAPVAMSLLRESEKSGTLVIRVGDYQPLVFHTKGLAAAIESLRPRCPY